jgi:hypothetical protein
MKKLLAYVFVASVLLFGVAGKCKKGPTPAPPGEATLAITLNLPVNSVQLPAPQADFPLTVTITSAMPPQGVTIDVSAKKDDGAGAAPLFTTSTNTSNTISNFTITNTPTSVINVTTVTVTSKTKLTNTWTDTYRYSRKP